jgi:hypothetical protein
MYQVSGNEENSSRKNTLEDDSPSSPSAHVNTPLSSRPPSFSSLDPFSDRSEQHELAASFQLDEDEVDEDDEDDSGKYNERSRLHQSTSTSSLASTVSRHSNSALHTSSNTHSLLAVPTPFGREEITSTPSPSGFVPRTGTDGVFANLAAKPDNSEVPEGKYDEPLPSYETAAADAAPPYWETTIITPGMDTDEVYVDGLPVGNFFAFIWNAHISSRQHTPPEMDPVLVSGLF